VTMTGVSSAALTSRSEERLRRHRIVTRRQLVNRCIWDDRGCDCMLASAVRVPFA
jgi:hypothetical protein